MKLFLGLYSLYCAAAVYFVVTFQPPEGAPPEPTRILPNGCLVAAYEYECALTARNELKTVTWARLVGVRYGLVSGHAYTVYALRNGNLWSYDIIHGSLPLDTRNTDIKSIMNAMKKYDRHIWAGEFLD